MQINQRRANFKIVIISLIIFWIAVKSGKGIADGKLKMTYIIMSLSILFMFPYIISKIGPFPFLCGLVFFFWLPFNSGLEHLSPLLGNIYPAEFGMWMLCMGILIHGSVTKSAQFDSAVSRFPFLPFALIIAGSLIANLASGNFFARDELESIRILCLLPAVTCFGCLYFIKTLKQAECLLWIFFISAVLLGLIYLFGPNVAPSEDLALLIEGDGGRMAKIIKLPLFGRLIMNAETTPVCFVFLLALSFNLWLNHPSYRGRLIGATVLVISALVIIRGQGRTALIAAICSVILIQILSSRFKSYLPKSFWPSQWKPAILIFSIIFGIWYYASTSKSDYFRQHGLILFTDPVESVSFRMYRWKTAAGVVLDNPFGVGVFGFPSIDGQSWVAHNLYLFQSLSFGFFGLIGFFWFFLRYTKACWSGLHSNSPDHRLLCIAGVSCTSTLSIGGLASCIYFSPWEALMVWIPIGITFAVATLRERGKRHRS